MTLVEVLIAVAITGLLLAGMSMVLSHLHSGLERMPWNGYAGRYGRAMELMRQDARGLIDLQALPEERSEHGEPLAMFRTTWRVDALADDRWAGSALVGYWLDAGSGHGDGATTGRTLWRSEAPAADRPDGIAWTPLLDGLESVRCQHLNEGEWVYWPRADAENASAATAAIRVAAVRAGTESRRAAPLPSAVLPTMHEAEDAKHHEP